MLLRTVAIAARITTEIEELKRSRNSPSVWKLHADSLVVLMDLASRLGEGVKALAADQRPEIQSYREPLRSSIEKLRARSAEAAKLIAVA